MKLVRLIFMSVKLVPKLRFSGFTDEWIIKKLNDVSDVNPKTRELPEKFIYIDLDSVNHGILTKFNQINKNDAPSRAQRCLDVNDILFQTVRPYQMNNLFFELYDGEYVASTGYAQIKSKIVPRFLYYYLHYNKFVNEVLNRCTGTSYPAINSNDLKKIKIKIPSSSNEQKLIGDLFYKLDHKIELLKDKYHYYQDFKKFLMHQIFAQKLSFVDYSEYPLKQISEKIENGFSGTQVNYETPFPVTRIETISSGMINYDKVGFVDEIPERYLLKEGDILLTNINSMKWIGNSVYYDGKRILYHGMNLMLLRSKNEINSKYLYYYITYNNNWFKKMACQAVNQASINKSTLEKFIVKIPDIKTQNNIANVLTFADEKINGISNQIELTMKFKKGLLQQMFV